MIVHANFVLVKMEWFSLLIREN